MRFSEATAYRCLPEGEPRAMKVNASRGLANLRAGRAEEKAVAELYALAGCVVYRLHDTGQTRGNSGRRFATNSPGIPDLMVFHVGTRQFWFHEVKSGTATPTPEQRRFAQ